MWHTNDIDINYFHKHLSGWYKQKILILLYVRECRKGQGQGRKGNPPRVIDYSKKK